VHKSHMPFDGGGTQLASGPLQEDIDMTKEQFRERYGDVPVKVEIAVTTASLSDPEDKVQHLNVHTPSIFLFHLLIMLCATPSFFSSFQTN
jgi:hypothetical protein